jgi:hypothetical protein
LGVRNISFSDDENSHSPVSGIDADSTSNKRPCGVADGFQVSQHVVEFHVDDSSNVFANDVSGLRVGNNTEHLRPDRTVIIRASLQPGVTERLARKSTCDDIDSAIGCAVETEDVGVDKRPLPPSPRTASVRLSPGCALLEGVFLLPLDLPSPRVGVGHNGVEVFLEDALAVGVEFNEGDGSESCPLAGETEPSDPCEKINGSWSLIGHIFIASN